MHFDIDGMWTRAEDPRNKTLSDLHAFEYPPSGRTGTLSNSYLVRVPAFEFLSYRACDSIRRSLACLSSHAKYKLQHDLMWNLHMHTDTQASNAASRPHDRHLYRCKSKCDGVYLRFKGLRQDNISYWTLGSADAHSSQGMAPVPHLLAGIVDGCQV